MISVNQLYLIGKRRRLRKGLVDDSGGFFLPHSMKIDLNKRLSLYHSRLFPTLSGWFVKRMFQLLSGWVAYRIIQLPSGWITYRILQLPLIKSAATSLTLVPVGPVMTNPSHCFSA